MPAFDLAQDFQPPQQLDDRIIDDARGYQAAQDQHLD